MTAIDIPSEDCVILVLKLHGTLYTLGFRLNTLSEESELHDCISILNNILIKKLKDLKWTPDRTVS